MSTAMLLSLTLIAALLIGFLEWAWRIERRTARRARDAARVGFDLLALNDRVYDQEAEPLTPAEQAAWSEFEREER